MTREGRDALTPARAHDEECIELCPLHGTNEKCRTMHSCDRCYTEDTTMPETMKCCGRSEDELHTADCPSALEQDAADGDQKAQGILGGTMTIDLSPHPSAYSPHVRVLKTFFETVIGMEAVAVDDGDAIDLAAYVRDALPEVRKAMSDVLTDDFLAIIDGKRLPGKRRA